MLKKTIFRFTYFPDLGHKTAIVLKTSGDRLTMYVGLIGSIDKKILIDRIFQFSLKGIQAGIAEYGQP